MFKSRFFNGDQKINRPFPSSKKSHFQSEAKCEAIDMKMIFNYDANKTHFHNKGFALSLVLKVRFFGTRKWPIVICTPSQIVNKYLDQSYNIKYRGDRSLIASFLSMTILIKGRHLFPSAKLTFSPQWLSQDISLFLHEIFLSLEISVHKSRSLFNF